jgi:hypothetical protein
MGGDVTADRPGPTAERLLKGVARAFAFEVLRFDDEGVEVVVDEWYPGFLLYSGIRNDAISEKRLKLAREHFRDWLLQASASKPLESNLARLSQAGWEVLETSLRETACAVLAVLLDGPTAMALVEDWLADTLLALRAEGGGFDDWFGRGKVLPRGLLEWLIHRARRGEDERLMVAAKKKNGPGLADLLGFLTEAQTYAGRVGGALGEYDTSALEAHFSDWLPLLLQRFITVRAAFVDLRPPRDECVGAVRRFIRSVTSRDDQPRGLEPAIDECLLWWCASAAMRETAPRELDVLCRQAKHALDSLVRDQVDSFVAISECHGVSVTFLEREWKPLLEADLRSADDEGGLRLVRPDSRFVADHLTWWLLGLRERPDGYSPRLVADAFESVSKMTVRSIGVLVRNGIIDLNRAAARDVDERAQLEELARDCFVDILAKAQKGSKFDPRRSGLRTFLNRVVARHCSLVAKDRPQVVAPIAQRPDDADFGDAEGWSQFGVDQDPTELSCGEDSGDGRRSEPDADDVSKDEGVLGDPFDAVVEKEIALYLAHFRPVDEGYISPLEHRAFTLASPTDALAHPLWDLKSPPGPYFPPTDRADLASSTEKFSLDTFCRHLFGLGTRADVSPSSTACDTVSEGGPARLAPAVLDAGERRYTEASRRVHLACLVRCDTYDDPTAVRKLAWRAAKRGWIRRDDHVDRLLEFVELDPLARQMKCFRPWPTAAGGAFPRSNGCAKNATSAVDAVTQAAIAGYCAFRVLDDDWLIARLQQMGQADSGMEDVAKWWFNRRFPASGEDDNARARRITRSLIADAIDGASDVLLPAKPADLSPRKPNGHVNYAPPRVKTPWSLEGLRADLDEFSGAVSALAQRARDPRLADAVRVLDRHAGSNMGPRELILGLRSAQEQISAQKSAPVRGRLATTQPALPGSPLRRDVAAYWLYGSPTGHARELLTAVSRETGRKDLALVLALTPRLRRRQNALDGWGLLSLLATLKLSEAEAVTMEGGQQ